jgi:type I restriction enzyme S subunit
MREDWVECTFEELTVSMKRGPFGGDLKKAFFVPKGHAVYEQQHAIGNDFSNLRYFVDDERFQLLKACNVGPGDYIVSCSGTMGKIARLPENRPKGVINQALLRIRLNEEIINHNYFLEFFKSSIFQKKILKDSRGSGMQNMAGIKEIKPISIEIPPFPEQRAIVAKIEELFSDLDKGITDLKKAQDQLVTFRQAVLKKAFEGELTKEWREQQINLPIADELLEQIKLERQKHYEQQLENWKQALKSWEKNGKEGKRPSRISKPKIVSEVKNEDIENYDKIPNTWYWSRFGNVTYKIGDIDHKMPKTFEGGLPYLSTGNIKGDGSIDFEGAKTISKLDFDRLALKIKPEKGDIIFPRYGTIGRNVLIDFDKEFLVSYACAIIKNITKLMDAKFALYYSVSPVIKREIKRYTVQTTQANIGIASIEVFVFPLCSKEEQHQIVREIESRLSVCDKIEQSITESLEKAKILRQSILKKAFEGSLLSETEITACKAAPDYEPASVLLKKIKSEKKK